MALNRRRRTPLPDLVCYHCQQSAEKYLKAYLVFNGINPPRIHALDQLLNLCEVHDSSLARLSADAVALNPYGIFIRYPDLSASVGNARDALAALRRIRRVLRRRLGL